MTALAVAAPNPAAADAAEQVARAGGSAVDAAIAAALVAMVNEVGLVSLSSGGFVTVQPAAGPAYAVDGWVDMPGSGARPTTEPARTWDVTTAYGGGVTITIGPGSVATHGSLAAFGEAHARDGRLPWRELVAPAVDVARGGFRLGSASRYYLDHVHETVFGWDPASHARCTTPTDRLTDGPGGRRRPRGHPRGHRRRRARARCTRATSPASSPPTCRPAAGCSARPTWRRTRRSSARR